jgi:hypothetical protein
MDNEYFGDPTLILPPDLLTTRMEQVRKLVVDMNKMSMIRGSDYGDHVEFHLLEEAVHMLLDSCKTLNITGLPRSGNVTNIH